jgi:hypothetical protein
MGNPSAVARCYQNFILFVLQHVLQRLQPVGLARRLVPAQPVDAGKPHRDAGFMARRALQALERDFQDQPLLGLVDDMADGTEFFDRVAADEAVDLQQLLVGEAEIGLADRHQLIAVPGRGPHAECVVGIIG